MGKAGKMVARCRVTLPCLCSPDPTVRALWSHKHRLNIVHSVMVHYSEHDHCHIDSEQLRMSSSGLV